MTKEMRLLKLSLHNFKGVKDFELEPDGQDVAIFGDNGTGKTTLADAWFWLLFGKDSANRADFDIKTISEDGKPAHGLEHEVEAALDLGDRSLILRKVYQENWTKKRGSATREFTGHTTDHFIDGVPSKKNEYEVKIASIVDEDAFKLLTNPRYFNEVLHWQARRKLLLEVCGDVRDEDVIISDIGLAELPTILNGRPLDDYRKIVQAKRTEINGELQKVPVRIDEAQRGLPEVTEDATDVQASLTEHNQQRKEKSQALANLEAGGGVAEETKKLRELEAEQLKLQKDYWMGSAEKMQTAKVQMRKLEDGVAEIESAIKNKRLLVADNQDVIVSSEKVMEQLRQEWKGESATSFTFEQSDTCPTCGQSLPTEQLEAARAKALADFNAKKAKCLEDISNKGKMAKTANEKAVIERATTETQITEVEAKLIEVKVKVTAFEAMVVELEAQEKDYTKDDAYIQLQEKKVSSESAILELKETLEPEMENQRQGIATVDQEIADCERGLAQIEQRASGLKRIEELTAQERQLAVEYERLEKELFLTEQFVRVKVKLLEGQINSKFKMARFKMFNQLVNGGIEECCETTFQGIPYSSALNNSARINIGLDIINTLSEHFGFAAPIWMDNAEAVTQMLPTDGQQIKLYVSEADKVLRIENGGNKQ